jgi:NADH-quinone oxidoreductase subunit E
MSAGTPQAPGKGTGAHPPAPGPGERERKRERLIEVLWELQEKRGWIADDDVKTAAAACGLTPLEVDEVASFYNLLLRRPAGRTPIFVCDSISCELRGSAALVAALEERLGVPLGGVTADGAFGLLPIVCLGHCERAPCVLAAGAVHGPCAPDAEGVARLLAEIADGSGAPPPGR